MSQMRVHLATEVDAELLSAMRELAGEEGRELQDLVNEALVDLIQKHRGSGVRRHVMDAYLRSHQNYGPLYTKLAG